MRIAELGKAGLARGRGWRVGLLWALATLAAAAPGTAQDAYQSRKRVGEFEKWIREASEDVRSGATRKALRTSKKVVRKMTDEIMRGEGSGPLLGVAVSVRALAEAGEGHLREAEWDWYTAISLNPSLAKTDLSTYGEAGRRLASIAASYKEVDESFFEPSDEGERRERKFGAEEGPEGSAEGRAGGEGGEAKQEKEDGAGNEKAWKCLGSDAVLPPQKLEAPLPEYPKGKVAGRVAEPVVVVVVIDRDGRPKHPRFPDSVDPILAFAALETIRDWEFRPASCAGRPVTVYYHLTVNFAFRSRR